MNGPAIYVLQLLPAIDEMLSRNGQGGGSYEINLELQTMTILTQWQVSTTTKAAIMDRLQRSDLGGMGLVFIGG